MEKLKNIVKEVLGAPASHMAFVAICVYALGYLVLRYHFTSVGIPRHALPFLDERFVYVGAHFLLILFMSLLWIIYNHPFHVIMAVVAYVVVEFLLYYYDRIRKDRMRNTALPLWLSTPGDIVAVGAAIVGIALATYYNYHYMTDFPALNEFTLKAALPTDIKGPLRHVVDLKDKSLHPFQFFASLVGPTALISALFLAVASRLRWKDHVGAMTPAALVGGLFAFLAALQLLLLPVNYGMVYYSYSLPRVQAIGPGLHLSPGQDAWLLWHGEEREVVTLLVRDRALKRKYTLTLNTQDVGSVALLQYEPIMKALFSDPPYVETIKLMIPKVSAAEKDNKVPRNALISAAKYGRTEALDCLIANGFNMDARSSAGRTALMEAAKAGHERVVRLLLDKGAHVKLHDKGGQTALMLAALSGHSGIVDRLCQAGADASATDSSGRTALDMALANGHFRVVNKLASTVGLDGVRQYGWNELSLAAVKGNNNQVEQLLRKGKKKIERDAAQRAPLTLAAAAGNLDTVKLFLGCSWCAEPKDLENALVLAASQNSAGIVKLLVRHGARPTPAALEEASKRMSWDVVEILLDQGVNVKNKAGSTALRIAAGAGINKIVKKLVQAGANPSVPDDRGKTALVWALEKNCKTQKDSP